MPGVDRRYPGYIHRMDELSSGSNSTQFRALYYLGNQIAQALTEFEDEDHVAPRATWSVSGIELWPFAQVAERFAEGAFWGVLQYTEQAGGAFLLLLEDTARLLVGALPNQAVSGDRLALLDTVLARVTDLFGQAWSDIATLEPQLGLFEEAPSLQDLQEIFTGLSGATPMASTTFRVAIPGQALGRLVLTIPQPYLIPLQQSLEAAAEMTFLNGKDDAIEERLDFLGDVPVPIQVSLGSTEMTLSELQNLEEADVILLDQLVTTPLEISLGGAKVLGKAGTSPDGMRRAVQIVRLGPEG